jgi:hypothetical protein
MAMWRKSIVGAAAMTALLGGIATAPSASASSNGFVYFHNKSLNLPTICLTQYAGNDSVIRKNCATPVTSTYGYHFDPNAVRGKVTINNGFSTRTTFEIPAGGANCYRESSSGSVHEATDKPCTWG